MSRKTIFVFGFLVLLLVMTVSSAVAASPMGTAFTYQGSLILSGSPVNGTCDFQFGLWSAKTGGTQQGSTQTVPSVRVTNGWYTVQLNGSNQFGANAFKGEARWLAIAVRCPAGHGSYTPLSPRQALAAAPYALYSTDSNLLDGQHGSYYQNATNINAGTLGTSRYSAYSDLSAEGYLSNAVGDLALNNGALQATLNADLLDGQHASAFALSTHNHDATYVNEGQADSIVSSMLLDGTILFADWASNGCASGQIPQWNGSAWACTGSAVGWSLTGNSGTDPDINFLGTTDDQPLIFKVNGVRALRLEPNATSPNMIGGFEGNWVDVNVYGGTINGGGNTEWPNVVFDNLSTIGGGIGNQAGNDDSDPDSGHLATIGGGAHNIAVQKATVGGGTCNNATGPGSTVAGGDGNTASGWKSTVGGGNSNTVSGEGATVAGGESNAASGVYATVGGGESNITNANDTTISGGTNNTASYQYATVSGGGYNTASNGYTTVCGGNSNTASGNGATVCGGELNTAAGDWSFAAGHQAKANSNGAFVWADFMYADFSSVAANEFAVRATGGVRFVSAIDEEGNPIAGVQLDSGGGSWSSLSDRNLKANFAAVNGNDILNAIASMPISTWNYRAQDESIRHIGPTAQDFYAAFGVGEDDTHITTIDADGVAMAGIQALYQQDSQLESRVAALEGKAGVRSGQVTIPLGWLLFGGLALVNLGAVVGRRWPKKGA